MKAYYLLLFTVLFTTAQASSQPKIELLDFEILVENTETGLKLTSKQGSAWTELSFSLNKDGVQAVDEYGMTTLGKVSDTIDPKLANFLFTVTKAEDEVVLKGIEGTSWIELFFTLRDDHKVTIDQNGYERQR